MYAATNAYQQESCTALQQADTDLISLHDTDQRGIEAEKMLEADQNADTSADPFQVHGTLGGFLLAVTCGRLSYELLSAGHPHVPAERPGSIDTRH